MESVPEADSERAIEQLARTGHEPHLHDLLRLHGADPEGREEVSEHEVRARDRLQAAPNLATYAAKFHEGRYVIGQIAGKMTKTGTIGYVGAFPIPEVVVRHQLLSCSARNR